MNDRIRFGILGLGLFAERAIAPAIQQSRNSELVAVQKRSPEAAQDAARRLGVPQAFSSPEALVACRDVDAVFIGSANVAHAPETLIAAGAGKHVLVEKPMAMNVAEAETMIRACRDTGVKLMVGHMVRLSPVVTRMKELIRSGRIGPVRMVRSEFVYDARLSKRGWLFDRKAAGGGPLFDIAVHCLDTIRFLLDDEVTSVRAHLEPTPTATRTESTAQLSLRFSGGVLATIVTSYEAPYRRSFLEVIGTEGTLSAEDFTRSGISTELEIVTGINGERGDRTREPVVVHNLYEEEITRFSAAILDGTPLPVPGEEGLANQRVLEEALRTGGS